MMNCELDVNVNAMSVFLWSKLCLIIILDKCCPLYIQVVVTECGNVEIKYCKTHKGHYNKVKYTFLKKPKKQLLVNSIFYLYIK